MKFSKKVLKEIANRLGELASQVELAQASLEAPPTGDDAEQILSLLDDIRIGSRSLLDLWMDEQYRVFPGADHAPRAVDERAAGAELHPAGYAVAPQRGGRAGG